MIRRSKGIRGKAAQGKGLGSAAFVKKSASEDSDIPQSGLRMWLKSDVGAHTSSDVPAANDELVRWWYNQAEGAAGGTRVTSLAASSTGSPVWKSSANGFPALQFTGNDGFNYTSNNVLTNFDIYVVLAKDNTGADSIITGRSNQFSYLVVRNAGGTQFLQAGGASAERAFAGYVQGQMMMIGARGNASEITARSGGALTTTVARTDANQNLDNIGVYFDGDDAPSVNFYGYMYEYILYSKELSASERTQVETYLQTKYGVL